MIYVGIDVAAEKHVCCILTESGKVLKQFTFSNDMPHQSRQNIGSEIPIFRRDSFPSGEAKRRIAVGCS